MGQLLDSVIAALVAASALAAILLGASAIGVLWVRRTWGRKRIELVRRLNGVSLGVATSGMRWLWSRPLPDRHWRTLQRARRDLARATGGAEHSVREASDAGASTGDLIGLLRRLQHAALDVDRSLRIAQQSSPADPVDELLAHAVDLSTSARRIQRAAAESLAELHRSVTADLVRHVRVEEQAIRRGTVH
jgi:hypothetical protein